MKYCQWNTIYVSNCHSCFIILSDIVTSLLLGTIANPLPRLTPLFPPVQRLTELATEGQAPGDDIKPKPYELPPDTEGNVVEAISGMFNSAVTDGPKIEEDEELKDEKND